MLHRPANSVATSAARNCRSSMVALGCSVAQHWASMRSDCAIVGSVSGIDRIFMSYAWGSSNKCFSGSVHRCSEDGEVIVRTERKVFRESRKGGNEHA